MNKNSSKYPIYWINLDKDIQRRKRMSIALQKGGWLSTRWQATDGNLDQEKFISYERYWQRSSVFPGSLRSSELDPLRKTLKSELACLCSWQRLTEHLQRNNLSSEWFLLMEDDVGSSLAIPHYWPYQLDDIIGQVGKGALVVQMAPINGRTRMELHKIWLDSGKSTLVVPKANVRSHGNGAVLINKAALPLLCRRIGRWVENFFPNVHILGHPCNVRPVADKWLYASLPIDKCWVATFPLFILEAKTSGIHQEHIQKFHKASRNKTLKIWEAFGYSSLIKADQNWFNC